MEQQNQGAKSSTAPAKQKVTLVSTRGEKKVVEFEGGKWKDLRKAIENSNYSLNNMKCVESINKHTLEHDEADVPGGDFILFIMPYKSKSGSLRTDLYSIIKGLIDAHGNTAVKDHFGNYTQKTTDVIEELVNTFPGGSGSTAKAEVTATKKKAIADVVESVKQSKTTEDTMANLDDLTDSQKLSLVIKVLMDIQNNLSGKTVTEAVATEEVAKVKEKSPEELAAEAEKEAKAKADKEAEEKRKADEAEAKRLKKEEEERLDKEMKDMLKGSGFNDIQR